MNDKDTVPTSESASAESFPRDWVECLLQCFDDSSIGISYRPDLSSDHMWWSPSLYEMLGYTPAEIPPSRQGYLALVVQDDRAGVISHLAEVDRSSANHTYDAEFRMRSRDGGVHWYRTVVSVTQNRRTKRPCVLAIVRRIDRDVVIARAELTLIQGALNVVLDNIGYPVVLVSADGNILQANMAASSVMGCPCATLQGKLLCEVFPEATDARVLNEQIRAVAASGVAKQVRIQQRQRFWQVDFAPLRDGSSETTRVVVLAQDITSLQREHEQLLQRERELTETLVREVNHRIKNHLQGLVGLLRRAASQGHSVAETIELAVAQTMAIAAVHGLLAEPGTGQLSVDALIKAIVTSLQSETEIPIETEFATSAGPLNLRQEISVPVALTLSETLTNAIKHTPPHPDARVTVRLTSGDSDVMIEIANSPATLGADAARARSNGGLALARALLSRVPGTLALSQAGSSVVARLVLEAAACTIPTEQH
jgi:PAS domain S-box-containing protein